MEKIIFDVLFFIFILFKNDFFDVEKKAEPHPHI